MWHSFPRCERARRGGLTAAVWVVKNHHQFLRCLPAQNYLQQIFGTASYLEGAAPHPAVSPCWLLPSAAPPGSGMLQEPQSRITQSTVGAWVGEQGAGSEQHGLESQPLPTRPEYPLFARGGAVGRRGQQWPGGSPAVQLR